MLLRAAIPLLVVLVGLVVGAVILWRSRLRGFAVAVALLAVAVGFFTFVVLTNPLDNWP